MRNRLWCLAMALAVFAGLVLASSSGLAATCMLKPKHRETGEQVYLSGSSTPDWLFQITEAQSFSASFQPKVVVKDGKEKRTWTSMGMEMGMDPLSREFKRVVKKQPRKYNSKIPFRGVARLGDERFGFVLDSSSPKTEDYGLLYFDLNGNGDLTDDRPIESTEAQKARESREKAKKEEAKRKKAAAEKAAAGDDKKDESQKKEKKAKAKRKVAVAYSRPSTSGQFPPIDLKIKIGGKKVDYRFFFSAYSYFQKDYGYVSASLTAGTYYEGEIELDGRRQRAVLVDYNSNGRFNDKTTISEYSSGPKGVMRISAQGGDVLFLDPKPVTSVQFRDPTALDFRHGVEKLVRFGGRYYDMKVAPAGDELTLEPSDVGLGSVTNPNANYTAVIYSSDSGTMKINGAEGKPVPVPEGEWKLLSYTIDLTNVKSPEEEKAEKEKAEAKAAGDKGEKKKGPGIFAAMVKAMGETASSGVPSLGDVGQPRTTVISAEATAACKPIKVVKDETVTLPFGPPYKTTVRPSYFQQQNDTMSLGLEMIGSAGEIVTNLSIKGARPDKPKIKILDPEGEVVNRGNFEYG
jgi:hypothetical protein